ncbi:ATP-binding cassette domain-containing protein [Hafnia alvei]|uniref:ATP-binding cassette domain-containing protein n=1 Tax=Hafnia alvei TaxID=569 RepID=UPI0010353DDC|nr:ATP-binding cassette domain-containing protein [Hafnia alvei]TBM15352.1 ATP-binding cassette domain-containing protein [Hafnia alvei]
MTVLAFEQFQVLLHGTPLTSALNTCVEGGQILTLMGPSGCGKSSLLLAMAGHAHAPLSTQGKVLIDNHEVTELPAYQRKIGLLFQDDLLFPHLNVTQNLLFALPESIGKEEQHQQVTQALGKIDMAEFSSRYPDELSGGQRARISLLRTLLSRPRAVALDEPFSKLDKSLRQQFRQWVFGELQQANIAALLVTHDEDDVPPNGQIIML